MWYVLYADALNSFLLKETINAYLPTSRNCVCNNTSIFLIFSPLIPVSSSHGNIPTWRWTNPRTDTPTSSLTITPESCCLPSMVRHLSYTHTHTHRALKIWHHEKVCLSWVLQTTSTFHNALWDWRCFVVGLRFIIVQCSDGHVVYSKRNEEVNECALCLKMKWIYLFWVK